MPDFNKERLAKLRETYQEQVGRAIEMFPDMYLIKDAKVLTQRTFDIIENDGVMMVSINSLGWKMTTEVLGLKPTYKAIIEYLHGR